MKAKIIPLFKPIGKTPLELIKELQVRRPFLANEKLSYAGRLDPMAEGIVLILVGEENKKRKEYEALPKTYTFRFVLGVATDTYDILGKVTKSDTFFPQKYEEKLREHISRLKGTRSQEYPPFSSKPVNGHPLYYWARKGELRDIPIPTKTIEIYESFFENSTTISAEKLYKDIKSKIFRVQGDFRQKEILQGWQAFFMNHATSFPEITMSVTCSSGTYVRGLVHEIGQLLQVPTMTTHITRTAVGNYHSNDSTE